MNIVKKIKGWVYELLIQFLPGNERKNKLLRKKVYHIEKIQA